jgi:hypothetical protein
VVGTNPAGIGQHYCVWVTSQDGSGVTQVQVPDDVMTRNGYASSYQFLLHGSNKGNGLLCSQLSNSGSAMSTTQRYVVKDGKLVADGDAIHSQDSQPKESATPDKAIADAKAKGLVVLTGTVRKMNGNDAADLCVNLGVLEPTLAEDMKTHPEAYGDLSTFTYTLFVLDEPQEIEWCVPDAGLPLSSEGRKTYVIDVRDGSGSYDSTLASHDGQHVTAAFDNKQSQWASQANPLGDSPSCSSVEVLAVG